MEGRDNNFSATLSSGTKVFGFPYYLKKLMRNFFKIPIIALSSFYTHFICSYQQNSNRFGPPRMPDTESSFLSRLLMNSG